MEHKFREIQNLHELLTVEGIPHTFLPSVVGIGIQIRVYADAEMTKEFDDCICHTGSHGFHLGLLETFNLNDCNGYETAAEVFAGWKKRYYELQKEDK